MDSTVWVATIGFASTIIVAFLSARWQSSGAKAAQLRQSRATAFGDCVGDLYEFERAAYNRAKARVSGQTNGAREPLRQEYYRLNAATRSSIARVSILCDSEVLAEKLGALRDHIWEYNDSQGPEDLRARHKLMPAQMTAVLDEARGHLQ